MDISHPGAFLLEALLIVGMVGSGAYYLIVLVSAEQLFRQRKTSAATTDLPAVSILKPLRGVDAGLYENLAGICRQDYPRLQLVCGVEDPDDPAVAIVRRLQEGFPDADISLVLDGKAHGANHKVGNLHNMYRHAKHDLIVIADADIRVEPNYLRHLAAPLLDPRNGLVTCPYRSLSTGGVPTLLESLFINTDFSAMVLAARLVEKATYAFGATIALRREILDEVGGFLPLADYLADDYKLGHRVAAAGYELVLVDHVVETITAVRSWRHLLRHQLRWARTYRICRPGGYFGSIVTHGTLWALVNLAYHGWTLPACLASAGLLALHYATALLVCRRHIGAKLGPAGLALLLPKDLLISLAWLLAFVGDTVWWSDRRFRVLKNGKMIELPSDTVSPVPCPEPHPVPLTDAQSGDPSLPSA